MWGCRQREILWKAAYAATWQHGLLTWWWILGTSVMTGLSLTGPGAALHK
jgi:hypothetical protein